MCFTLLYILCTLLSYSQGRDEYLPPSPISAQINKYIEIPVDISSGLPDISIPLHVISSKGINIPISLNYHSSGIKLGQSDGNVGLGWSLSCDYRVSRNIYGLPDSKYIEFSSSLNRHLAGNQDSHLSRFHYKTPRTPFPDENMPTRNGGALDGEYDQFYFQYPNYSGKFILTNRSGYQMVAVEITHSNNRIEIGETTSSSGITGIFIHDDNGNKYSFGYKNLLNGMTPPIETLNTQGVNAITAWGLNEIKTKYGKSINFEYDMGNIRTKYFPQYTLSVKQPAYTGVFQHPENYWDYYPQEQYNTDNYNVFNLKRIVSEFEVVNIEYENQQSNKKIKTIEINNIHSGELKKKIDFFYAQKYVFPEGYIFLDSIVVRSSDNIHNEVFRFTYYDKNIDLNNKYFIQDQWGFIKVSSNRNGMLHDELGNDYAQDQYSYNSFPYNIPANTLKMRYRHDIFDNKYENDNPWIFSLKTIKYPTGGITEFRYEHNKIANYKLTGYSGGIRIKSISFFDGADKYNSQSFSHSKNYFYGKNKSGFGFVEYNITENDFREEFITQYHLNEPVFSRNVFYSSSILSELQSKTFYEEVTEKSVDFNFNSMGEVLSVFSNLRSNTFTKFPVNVQQWETPFYNTDGLYYTSQYRDWIKPTVKAKFYFDNNGILKRKENYFYEVPYTWEYDGAKVRAYVKPKYEYVNSSINNSYPAESYFRSGEYSISVGKHLLKELRVVNYLNTDSVVNTHNYFYNEHFQKNKEIIQTSGNGEIVRNFLYPIDLTDEDISGLMMYNLRDFNYLLEENESINGIENKRVVNKYSVHNNVIVLDSIKQVLNNDTLNVIAMPIYDTYGNPLEVKKQNLPSTVYLWGYSGQYPVAKIENATYQQVLEVLGGGSTQANINAANSLLNQLNAVSVTDGTIINTIQTLRTQLSNSQIWTYTYKPLVGMSSEIDPRGIKTEYKYDGFQRLKDVLDFEDYYLKTYQYNYRP